jgi:hypothetical protein
MKLKTPRCSLTVACIAMALFVGEVSGQNWSGNSQQPPQQSQSAVTGFMSVVRGDRLTRRSGKEKAGPLFKRNVPSWLKGKGVFNPLGGQQVPQVPGAQSPQQRNVATPPPQGDRQAQGFQPAPPQQMQRRAPNVRQQPQPARMVPQIRQPSTAPVRGLPQPKPQFKNPLKGSMTWLQNLGKADQANRPAPQQRAARPQRQQPPAGPINVEPKSRPIIAAIRSVARRPAASPATTPKPRTKQETALGAAKPKGLFAFLKKGDSSATTREDWSEEAKRAVARREQEEAAKRQPQVQLASLSAGNRGNDFGRWLKAPFNSWSGVAKEKNDSWNTYVVTTNRTPFYALGRPLDPHRPDLYLNAGTHVSATKKGWNWSNVILGDGRLGTVAAKSLSLVRPGIAPKSADVKSRQAPEKVTPAKPTLRQPGTALKPMAKPWSRPVTPKMNDDPFAEIGRLQNKSSAKPEEQGPSPIATDAILDPSLESVLASDPAPTLKDDLVLPEPPVVPEGELPSDGAKESSDRIDFDLGIFPPID